MKKKEILHEIYKKLILSLSTLDLELKQTRKIHDMIKSEFASVFTNYCYEQDTEFFENRQKAKEEQERQEKEKREQNQGDCGKSSCGSCGINDEPKKDYTKSDNENFDEIESIEKPQDVKKLYRKIVMVVHPDKNEGMDDKDEKERRTELYKEATQAYNDSDMSTLIRIAVELGIKTPDPNEEQMQVLHDKVKDIKIDIATIENTVAWVWYYSDEKTRAYLMQKHFEFVRNKHEK